MSLHNKNFILSYFSSHMIHEQRLAWTQSTELFRIMVYFVYNHRSYCLLATTSNIWMIYSFTQSLVTSAQGWVTELVVCSRGILISNHGSILISDHSISLMKIIDLFPTSLLSQWLQGSFFQLNILPRFPSGFIVSGYSIKCLIICLKFKVF